MNEVYLYGASGHGKVIAEILEQNGDNIQGIFDDDPAVTGLLDYPALGGFDGAKLSRNARVIVSIGNNHQRCKVVNQLNVPFATAVHPGASVSKRCTIGEGTVVMAGVSINADVKVGEHVILNTNCSVDHDCELGNFVHVSPNVALAGNVKVGEGTHLGIGACVIQGIIIGKWATIGAGTVVITDVPDNAVIVGNPGRIIKYSKGTLAS
ncbi:acetyltransferase [uncultured Chitinophaga sp.]|jgi:sugar O-acyltransferase, sialic acid O-acetyltransferase NeuD family|uniref:acetyltransferase n=1 Tax=uncultured Chitinophaga sp. TaxID=339340 RepID=UPI0026057E86|nr:acetyltransferase [uncultured Chitinophaga sp.]